MTTALIVHRQIVSPRIVANVSRKLPFSEAHAVQSLDEASHVMNCVRINHAGFTLRGRANSGGAT